MTSVISTPIPTQVNEPVGPSPLDTPTPLPPQPEPETSAERAVADLAERLNVAPEQIEVVSVVTEDFPAQNLGCPTGTTPAVDVPAFVIGEEITLRVEDEWYIYRARGRQLVYCGTR